jgi:hypothetical protein
LAELTEAGTIAPVPGEGGWTRYSRQMIEDVLGRPLEVEEYLEAERAHDRRREINRRHNTKRRARGAL